MGLSTTDRCLRLCARSLSEHPSHLHSCQLAHYLLPHLLVVLLRSLTLRFTFLICKMRSHMELIQKLFVESSEPRADV